MITTKNIELKNGEPMHITFLSDLHLESPLARRDELKRVIDSRRNLENHRIIIIGDLLDLIVPSDMKRFTQSISGPHVDDYINEIIDDVVGYLKSFETPIDLISMGNHEYQAVKRHHIDAIKIIAREVGASYGGYSGVLDYEIDSNGSRTRARIIYHHGAWSAPINSTVGRATQYFMRWPDWDIAVFGHDHEPFVKPESRPRVVVTKNGKKVVEKKCYIVNCGSWVKTHFDDERVTFYELKAMKRVPHVAVMAKIKPSRKRDGGTREMGLDIEISL